MRAAGVGWVQAVLTCLVVCWTSAAGAESAEIVLVHDYEKGRTIKVRWAKKPVDKPGDCNGLLETALIDSSRDLREGERIETGVAVGGGQHLCFVAFLEDSPPSYPLSFSSHACVDDDDRGPRKEHPVRYLSPGLGG